MESLSGTNNVKRLQLLLGGKYSEVGPSVRCAQSPVLLGFDLRWKATSFAHDLTHSSEWKYILKEQELVSHFSYVILLTELTGQTKVLSFLHV